MAFEVNLPPAQILMFQELIAQMKENNIQTRRIADFLEFQNKEAIALGLVPGIPPPKSS